MRNIPTTISRCTSRFFIRLHGRVVILKALAYPPCVCSLKKRVVILYSMVKNSLAAIHRVDLETLLYDFPDCFLLLVGSWRRRNMVAIFSGLSTPSRDGNLVVELCRLHAVCSRISVRHLSLPMVRCVLSR